METDRLVYFGDSLSDTGTLAAALDAVFGPGAAAAQVQIGPEGAISNAFAHPTYTAAASGLAVESVAVAGAQAAGTNERVPGFDINLGGQVERFLAASAGADLSTTKAVFFIGINDFSAAFEEALASGVTSLAGLTAIANETGAAVQGAIGAAAQRLAAAGLTQIELVTLPLPRFFPQFDGLPDQLRAGIDLILWGYNLSLGSLAATLGGAGLSVGLADVSALSIAVTEDPEGLGILVPRAAFLIPEEGIPQPFLDAGAVSVSEGPVAGDQAGYWDPLHPGQAIHEIWGAYTARVLGGAETTFLDYYDETATGTAGDDVILAYAGDDTLDGGRGADVVLAGSGADLASGGNGDDVLAGGSGADALTGGRGADAIGGGTGDDVMRGGRGRDLIADGRGADEARGGAGNDTFVFVDERLIGGDDTPDGDLFVGGKGDDTLHVVVPEALAAAFADAVAAGQTQPLLDALGIEARGIETVEMVTDRAGLAEALDGVPGALDADLWGLV